MSIQQHFGKGYQYVERHLENWVNPILFWYIIDVGDKAMKDYPIISDRFVTNMTGERIDDIIKPEEWRFLEASV